MDKDYTQYLFDKTCQDYNLIAEEFSRTREKPWPELQFLFDDFLTPGEKILDVGCGNGRFFEFCRAYRQAGKEKNLDYSGIDSSEKLIEIAKNSYPEAKFQVADVLSLPFPNNYFDKVYSIAVLHHMPSEYFRLQCLKEAKKALKPEGLLIVTCWKFHQPKELFFILKFTILKLLGLSKLDFGDILEPWGKKIKRYYHCFSEKELVSLVREAGFKIKDAGLLKNEKGNRQNIYLIAQK